MARYSHLRALGWLRAVADGLWREQDATLVGWLQGSFPSGPLGEAELAALSARLAVVPARPNPGCLAGVVSDCATALGLGLGPDTLSAWYDSTAWPGLAWQSRESVPRSEWTLRNLCSVRNYAACREVLPRGTIVPPVGASGRQLLVRARPPGGRPRSLPAPHRRPRRTPCPAPGGRGGHPARRAAQAMDRRRAFRHARCAATGRQARRSRPSPGVRRSCCWR